MKQTLINPSLRPYSRQRGFSLIELIVAMVVAVFLLAGLFTVLQGTRDTSTEQTALTQLQDNERFAMQVFTNMVESAGYFPTVLPDGTANSLTSALPIDGTTYPTAGQSISGAGNGMGGDSIVARFQTNPNEGVSSCLGHTNTTTGTVIYKNTLQVDSTQNALTCSDGNGVTAVPLISGVQQLTILWGVNSSAAAANSNCPADTYLTTAQFAAATNLEQTNVCTVQVTLVFTNPLYQPVPGGPVTPGQPHTITFTKLIAVMSKAGPVISSFT
ncbi:MAG: prepilin-type N-terminal cleavage/methylation domain-containing protein [Steroidobacteraceae bacterium]